MSQTGCTWGESLWRWSVCSMHGEGCTSFRSSLLAVSLCSDKCSELKKTGPLWTEALPKSWIDENALIIHSLQKGVLFPLFHSFHQICFKSCDLQNDTSDNAECQDICTYLSCYLCFKSKEWKIKLWKTEIFTRRKFIIILVRTFLENTEKCLLWGVKNHSCFPPVLESCIIFVHFLKNFKLHLRTCLDFFVLHFIYGQPNLVYWISVHTEYAFFWNTCSNWYLYKPSNYLMTL